MKTWICFVIFFALIITCCQTPQMNIASGRPETTIPANRSEVKSKLASELINRHFDIIGDSELVLVADGDAGGWADFWFTNTMTGERPRIRIRFTLIESNGS